MEHAPPQLQAHLVVAAVRVLAHKTGRPPAVEEVAELLGWSRELVGHLSRGLESRGILQALKSPFDVRLEVADHLKIEELPKEDSGPQLKEEVEAFHEQLKKRQAELQNLFDSGEQAERARQRHEDLDSELRDFKAPRRFDPFGGAGEDKR